MLALRVHGTLDHLILGDLSLPCGVDSHSVPALLLLQAWNSWRRHYLGRNLPTERRGPHNWRGTQRNFVLLQIGKRVRALVEYEATFVDVSPGNEKGTTSYRTIRVQKWLSIPKGKRDGSNPLPVMVLPGRPRSGIVHEQHCPGMICNVLVLLVNTVYLSSGVWLPLWIFGYFDSDCDNFPDDCVDGCRSWDVQLAYVIAAVATSLLLRIINVTEPSVVTVAGQEMKDMSTGVPMIFDSDTFDSDTETTESSIC
jgi:hypothetical protein